MDGFWKIVGQVLRDARLEAGYTLYEVRDRSGGRFLPSTLGGYERGQRAITLDRFCDLAVVYDQPPQDLLAEVVRRSGRRGGPRMRTRSG